MITTAVMSKRKRSEHYVNNKEFLAALIKYREDVEITFIRLNGENPQKKIDQKDGKQNLKSPDMLESVF
jgi:hypothetical protein